MLTPEKVEAVLKELNSRAGEIEQMATEANVSQVTLPKSEKTAAKLTSMRDLYVGDEWDNPTELMEWSGFFEGAAIVHWELVAGAALGINNSRLESLSRLALSTHREILNTASRVLNDVGLKKSTS